jgi:hypothetical protein
MFYLLLVFLPLTRYTPHPNPLPQGERERKKSPLSQGEREHEKSPLPLWERVRVRGI